MLFLPFDSLIMGSSASNVKPQDTVSCTEANSNSSAVILHKDTNKQIQEPAAPKTSDGSLQFREQERIFEIGKPTYPSTKSSQDGRRESKETPSSGQQLPPMMKKSQQENKSKSQVIQNNSIVNKSIDAKEKSLEEKVRHLEHELANSESERLDVEDRIRILESRLKTEASSEPVNRNTAQLSETVHAKDQYIVKLEKDMKALQAESNATRLKLKKRIKGLVNKLHEARQEASITQMELKQDLAKQEEKIKNRTGASASAIVNAEDSGNGKLIVELSNQLSEQEDRIASLEAQVVEKDLLIESLQTQCDERQRKEGQDSSGAVNKSKEPTGDRLQSGRGSRYQSSTRKRTGTADSQKTDLTAASSMWPPNTLSDSDSDSDWDTSEVASHTHSAPARVRVKSAISTHSTAKAKLGGNLQSDDDSIMKYLNSSEMPRVDESSQRVKPQKKSALKNHLEKRKVENQMSALMGPSVAFASRGPELPSDTSCEPTPRNTEGPRFPGFPQLTVVNTTHY